MMLSPSTPSNYAFLDVQLMLHDFLIHFSILECGFKFIKKKRIYIIFLKGNYIIYFHSRKKPISAKMENDCTIAECRKKKRQQHQQQNSILMTCDIGKKN
jgi:hypothetical protein